LSGSNKVNVADVCKALRKAKETLEAIDIPLSTKTKVSGELGARLVMLVHKKRVKSRKSSVESRRSPRSSQLTSSQWPPCELLSKACRSPHCPRLRHRPKTNHLLSLALTVSLPPRLCCRKVLPWTALPSIPNPSKNS